MLLTRIIVGGVLLTKSDIKIKKIWETICKEAEVSLRKSNYMKKYFKDNILDQVSFGDALSHIIAVKVSSPDFELGHLIPILQKQISK